MLPETPKADAGKLRGPVKVSFPAPTRKGSPRPHSGRRRSGRMRPGARCTAIDAPTASARSCITSHNQLLRDRWVPKRVAERRRAGCAPEPRDERDRAPPAAIARPPIHVSNPVEAISQKLCRRVTANDGSRRVDMSADPVHIMCAAAVSDQPDFMWTGAQLAKSVNPPGTSALAAAMCFACSGPK
jgi:hypothetical protein